jgi:hypothetical protein
MASPRTTVGEMRADGSIPNGGRGTGGARRSSTFAVATSTSSTMNTVRALAAWCEGQDEVSIQLLQEFLKKYPYETEARYRLATVYEQQERYSEELEHAVVRAPARTSTTPRPTSEYRTIPQYPLQAKSSGELNRAECEYMISGMSDQRKTLKNSR